MEMYNLLENYLAEIDDKNEDNTAQNFLEKDWEPLVVSAIHIRNDLASE